MSNIADLIEDYILTRLAEQQTGQVELRRTDIADEISCAPSQISYVLNTRFTHDKGFSVESRRGLGGFIRVVRVPLKNIIYQEMLEKLDKDTDFVEIKAMLHYLIQHEMISTRECTFFCRLPSLPMKICLLSLEPSCCGLCSAPWRNFPEKSFLSLY